jgi:hypothetical protein
MVAPLLAVAWSVQGSQPGSWWAYFVPLGVALLTTALVDWWARRLRQTEHLRRPEGVAFFDEDDDLGLVH